MSRAPLSFHDGDVAGGRRYPAACVPVLSPTGSAVVQRSAAQQVASELIRSPSRAIDLSQQVLYLRLFGRPLGLCVHMYREQRFGRRPFFSGEQVLLSYYIQNLAYALV